MSFARWVKGQEGRLAVEDSSPFRSLIQAMRTESVLEVNIYRRGEQPQQIQDSLSLFLDELGPVWPTLFGDRHE